MSRAFSELSLPLGLLAGVVVFFFILVPAVHWLIELGLTYVSGPDLVALVCSIIAALFGLNIVHHLWAGRRPPGRYRKG